MSEAAAGEGGGGKGRLAGGRIPSLLYIINSHAVADLLAVILLQVIDDGNIVHHEVAEEHGQEDRDGAVVLLVVVPLVVQRFVVAEKEEGALAAPLGHKIPNDLVYHRVRGLVRGWARDRRLPA